MTSQYAIAVNVRKATIADACPKPKKPPIAWINVPTSLWVRVATQEALLAGARPSLVLGTSRTKKARAARWRAWRTILDGNPRYSVKSLATVCGYDHTAILHAMKRMKAKDEAGATPEYTAKILSL